MAIGHFGKYHNILCLSLQILHKQRETGNYTLGGQTKSIMVFSEVAYGKVTTTQQIEDLIG